MPKSGYGILCLSDSVVKSYVHDCNSKEFSEFRFMSSFGRWYSLGIDSSFLALYSVATILQLFSKCWSLSMSLKVYRVGGIAEVN